MKKIVNRNCVEVPYEGTEVNKSEIVREILNLFDQLEKIKDFNEKNGKGFEDCFY